MRNPAATRTGGHWGGSVPGLRIGINLRMKTNHFVQLFTAALGFAALSNAGCARQEKLAGASLATDGSAATPKATITASGPTTDIQVATPSGPDVASAKWSDIKDCTFDMRAQFFTGLDRLEARVDGQIVELTAQRAAMKSTGNNKDWDFAMKEMEDARTYLKSTGEDLSKATPEIWDQEKDKVGQAWVRTQEAYDKVKKSTTS